MPSFAALVAFYVLLAVAFAVELIVELTVTLAEAVLVVFTCATAVVLAF